MSSFQSSHLPLDYIETGNGDILIPNRAIADYNLERNSMDRYITNYDIHLVDEGEQFSAPTISWKSYGDETYWWFICYYNGIMIPTQELKAGLKIKLPNLQQMKTYLNKSNRQNNLISEFTRV